jgi:molecular chaperone DnaK
MDEIVGIDLGTTNSLIGVMEAGFPILLTDNEGHRLTPSIVYLPEHGEPLVGRPAERMRVLRPEATIYSIKRYIGLRSDDLAPDQDRVGYKLQRRKGDWLRVQIGEKTYLPEEISARVLRKLKHDAEVALGHPVSRAVISVPAYFNDAQRAATRRAGELAGFTVERIINEPTAAALAYGLERLGEKSKIAVYDFGGGTFDLSILELNGGVFEVLATNGNTRLGGDDIDDALLGDARFSVVQTSPEARARIRETVIAAKHRLSDEDETTIEVPFLEGTSNFATRLTRPELNRLARPIVERTGYHCRRALADARLRVEELDQVILVGGVTRMPIVREFVGELFQRDPLTNQNPDEAVGLGATIQAGILAGNVQNMVLLDVTPLSLGIETFGGLMNVIIPRNSTIPVKAGEMFTTAVDNQRAMAIKVLQGEREMAKDNWPLGRFDIEFPPAPKGVARVGVQFEIDADGILHVLARDTKTGKETVVEMKSAIDVTDEAVEAMLAESLDHAFEDVNERIWVETKLKSDEMLGAMDKALAIAGNRISVDERQLVEKCADEVRHALHSGDRNALKRANEALDAATQHLAAVVVETLLSGASQP